MMAYQVEDSKLLIPASATVGKAGSNGGDAWVMEMMCHRIHCGQASMYAKLEKTSRYSEGNAGVVSSSATVEGRSAR